MRRGKTYIQNVLLRKTQRPLVSQGINLGTVGVSGSQNQEVIAAAYLLLTALKRQFLLEENFHFLAKKDFFF